MLRMITISFYLLLPSALASTAFLEERDNRFETPEEWEASDGIEWDSTWGEGIEPGESFDAGSPLPALEELVKSRPDIVPAKGKVLIPGCGRGYAVEALAGKGRLVIGIDIAPTAVAAANEYLKTRKIKGKWKVTADPFFDFSSREKNQDSFDLIYDYNFLSIIPPHWRAKWARRVKSVLKPGGVIIVVIYPDGNSTEGPPWTMDLDIVGEMLERNGLERIFEKELLEDEEVHEGREDQTSIAAWRKPVGLMHYQIEWYRSWQQFQRKLADEEALRGEGHTEISPWKKLYEVDRKQDELKLKKNWFRNGATSLR